MIKINFSGYPIRDYDEQPLIGKNLPITANELNVLLEDTITNLSSFDNIKNGESVLIVLPSQVYATAILISLWYSKFKSFPSINWPIKTKRGFEWPPETKIDLEFP